MGIAMTIKRMAMMISVVLLVGCTDTLTDDILTIVDSDGDLLFNVSTLEQADMTVGIGTTRAPGDSTMRITDTFVAHQLTGSNPDGLTIHRMPLPYMGIHHGTVSASSVCCDNVETPSTRAHKDAIVTEALNNFHDSLTIWGYTSHPYKTTGANDAENSTVFYQTLLKRIRNWRSSAHWPYGGDKMKFYALAPSMENINVIEGGTPCFSTPPTITYTLPEKAAEMCDLLWGESDIVDVEAGPAGTPLYPGASTPREQHLGKDDKMVDLTFQHILTAIRFAQGNIPTGITIKKIVLHNVRTQGTFNPADTDPATSSKGAWGIAEAKADYALWPNTAGSGTTNTYIDHDSLFFMIPHTVTDAELQVTIEVKPRYKVDANGVYLKDASGNYIPSDNATPAVAHILTCALAGDVWKKGYTVTYKLTVGEVADGYYLVAENPAEAEHSTSTTNGSFAVHSYRRYYNLAANEEVTTHGVEWKVEGYYSNDACTTPSVGSDATTPPTWFTTAPHGTSGSTGFVGGYTATANYTIKAQEKTKSGKHTEILQRNSVTHASNIDLSSSTPDGRPYVSPTTANCYIVNRLGSYTFPLVYGNKTSDGDEATAFVDHKGETITKKLIKDQIEAKTPAAGTYEIIEANTSRKRTSYTWNASSSPRQTLRSAIVWQDLNGLFTSPTISSTNIGFTVSIAAPGNAVIALQGRTETVYEKSTDGGTNWTLDTDKGTAGYEYGDWETFWTWHIWMTDEVFKNTGTDNGISDDYKFLDSNDTQSHDHLVSITNKDNPAVITNILPVNLGWVPDNDDFGYYSKRECWVKLRQVAPMSGEGENTNQSCVVHIVQHAKQDLITGTSTVYQWGRPTALPAVCHINKTSRTVYLGSEFSSSTFTLENMVEAGDIITKPTKLLRQPYGTSWFSTSGSIPAYWSSTKTVYDPCPPGFQLPAYSIFSGFSLTGGTADNGTSLNIWQDAAEHGKGAYFYATPHTTTVPATDRYGQTVYMPATGQYKGNKAIGTPLNTTNGDNAIFIDANAGMVWSYDVSDTQGKSLWYYPEWNYTKANAKPAIALPWLVNFSTAMPIRPTGTLPGY